MEYFNKARECMSADEKHHLQSLQLQDAVKREYQGVETYRKKMQAIGIEPGDVHDIEDITKLPFTTKQDLRDNYPYGMFALPLRDIVRIHASSGTTGKLTVAGLTQKDVQVWAECCARALVAAGASKESVVHVAYGYGLFTGGLGAHYGAELLGATAVPASAGNTQRQIQLIQDFGADTICCTPSYAIYLADEMHKLGLTAETIKLKRGLFGAEPWTEEMRREIETKMGIVACDLYGLSEISGPGVASECVYQTGPHVNDDYFYPEIVDTETLQPLPYGERGELVFTTLVKEGMPLIRYRTRDITSLDDSPCPCGRTGVRIKRVTGRSDDMLIIRGVNVFPSQVESALLADERVSAHYHITLDRINNLDTMSIDVELNPGVASDEVSDLEQLQKKIAASVASAISVNATIRLVPPGSIARSEGKAKRVTDKRVLK